VFATKDSSPTRTTLMDNNSFSFVQTLDTEQNKIMYDRTVALHTTQNVIITPSTYSTHRIVHIWIPGNKIGYKGKLQFVDNSATALKGFSPWLAVFAGTQNDSGASACSLMWNGKFYFKDA